MTEHYIQNNTVCFPLDSREWLDYKGYLENKLAELEEQKKSIDVRIAEIHRTLNPDVIVESKQKENVESTKLYRYSDVARILGVSEPTISEMCRSKKIPHLCRNNSYWIREEDLSELKKLKEQGKILVNAGKVLAPHIEGMFSAREVRDMLDITLSDIYLLVSNNLLTIVSSEEKKATGESKWRYFAAEEVETIKKLMDEEGGAKSFIDKIRKEATNDNG